MKLRSISWRRCETVKLALEVLAAAEQVALAQADVAEHAVLRSRSRRRTTARRSSFSTTLVLMITLSGALPCTVLTSTFRRSRDCAARCCERRSRAVLKASPSASRNSRRITSSSVRTLPLMSMRST